MSKYTLLKKKKVIRLPPGFETTDLVALGHLVRSPKTHDCEEAQATHGRVLWFKGLMFKIENKKQG